MRNWKFLPGFQEFGCHMIFDINMDGKLTRKARIFAVSHTPDPPTPITYSIVVLIYSVCIAFMLDVKNVIDVYSTNIGNA